MFRIALANNAAYAVVPQDAIPILPLIISSDASLGEHLPGATVLETIPLTVEGDPDGTATAFSERAGDAAELTWTPSDREVGRRYVANLAHGTLEGPGVAPVQYTPSTFEFSYIDGTRADLLPEVELTLSDVREGYWNTSACCSVDAALCTEASHCFQCWDRAGALFVTAAWTGPGLPYLSLETVPGGTAQEGRFGEFAEVTEFGEFCAEGTARAGDETRSLSVCHTVTEWPSVEVEGRHTVFADTCTVIPPGYSPLTRLFVVRGATTTEALQALSGETEEPAVASRDVPNTESSVSRCGVGSRPVEGSTLPWLAALAALGAAGRRRSHPRRVSGR